MIICVGVRLARGVKQAAATFHPNDYGKAQAAEAEEAEGEGEHRAVEHVANETTGQRAMAVDTKPMTDEAMPALSPCGSIAIALKFGAMSPNK